MVFTAILSERPGWRSTLSQCPSVKPSWERIHSRCGVPVTVDVECAGLSRMNSLPQGFLHRLLQQCLIILGRGFTRVGSVAMVGQRALDDPGEKIRGDAQFPEAGGEPKSAGHVEDHLFDLITRSKPHGLGHTLQFLLVLNRAGLAIETNHCRQKNRVEGAMVQD